MSSNLESRLRRLEEVVRPKGEEIWVTVPKYDCMSDQDVARQKARAIRAILGRERQPEDIIHCCVVTEWVECPDGPHRHAEAIIGGIVHSWR